MQSLHWAEDKTVADLVPFDPELTSLILGEMPIGDELFPHLTGLSKLESLNLAYTNVSSGFDQLAHLPLRDVRLEGCRRLNDESMRQLARIPTLRQLEVQMTPITDAGVQAVAGLPLEVFWAGGRVTDAGIQALAGTTTLRHLDLCAGGITDASIRVLASLPNLEVLWLVHCQITDASLDLIASMPKLRELTLEHTLVSEAGRRRFDALKPAAL